MCCAARPVAPHPTARATTVGPAPRVFHGGSSAVHHYAPSAPTAPTAAREFQRAQRRVTTPQTPSATTVALARSTRIAGTAPTAPTAARGFQRLQRHQRQQRHRPRLASAERRAALSVIPRMAFATTAAPAQSTRIVGTAPTAPTVAPAPREARRPLPLRRRPAPMLCLVVHQHAQEIMIHILESSSAQLSMEHTGSIFKSHFLCMLGL